MCDFGPVERLLVRLEQQSVDMELKEEVVLCWVVPRVTRCVQLCSSTASLQQLENYLWFAVLIGHEGRLWSSHGYLCQAVCTDLQLEPELWQRLHLDVTCCSCLCLSVCLLAMPGPKP
jgi:hypothetical protein